MAQDSKRFRDFARFALENLSDGAFLITKEGRIVHVNDAACRQVGYTREEMIGMSMLEINPLLTQEIWDSMWLVTAREKKQTIETEHRTKDGRLVPVEVLANYLEFDGAEYSCAFARDITERRAMERRIRQAEKMEAIGQLAGGVAHDFNNQLAGIVGFADLLARELEDRPDLASMAEAILKAAKRSSGLTAQLLAFSRQGKYQSTPVDLNQIIDEVVTLLGRSIDKTIHISTKYLAAPAVTLGDPSQLQNAVLNLAINARDAMPTGGELTFATSNVVLDKDYCSRSPYHPTPGKYIQISVIDTGMGMSAETQDRMFEPFFTTKATGKGTGMGLAAVYGTMKSHKGVIGVYSELGHGTEMKLYFPQADENASAGDGTPSPTLPTDLQKTVLLVEDEALLRDMMSGMLQRLGCKIILAKNGKEAVDIFRRSFEEIDLVILDLVMPELGGRDAYVQLSKIQPTVRVIIASGYSLDSDVQNLLDQGVKGFIQKPFRLEEIAKAIVEATENR
jgi:two-component system, cell cycle sensor histidine kinase and response regulator CckA